MAGMREVRLQRRQLRRGSSVRTQSLSRPGLAKREGCRHLMYSPYPERYLRTNLAVEMLGHSRNGHSGWLSMGVGFRRRMGGSCTEIPKEHRGLTPQILLHRGMLRGVDIAKGTTGRGIHSCSPDQEYLASTMPSCSSWTQRPNRKKSPGEWYVQPLQRVSSFVSLPFPPP